jgi:glutamate formiminotransferase/glutamate formiminotransferase/formiminotetrahydrofolate cyclodeaminase
MNVSSGRDPAVIDALAEAAGTDLLDVHTDPFHNRSVLTLVGEDAARRVATVAIDRIDLRRHRGVHPRLGAVDVVPFVPLGGSTIDDAVAARDRYAAWSPVPCVRYGVDQPTLPEIRRTFRSLVLPHPTAGVTAVGARTVLVAYNLWLRDESVRAARGIAAAVRSPSVRALGLAVGARVQVSMNLVDPFTTGPVDVYDAVARLARVDGAELVGLVPRAVLDAIPRERWDELDVDDSRTIEARLASRASSR